MCLFEFWVSCEIFAMSAKPSLSTHQQDQLIPYLHYIPTNGRAVTSNLNHPKLKRKFTCFDQCVYLVQAKVSMALGDCLAEVVGERVEHAVVRVNRRQAVLVQLVSHDANQLFHSLVVVCPVTHNLEKGEEAKNK